MDSLFEDFVNDLIELRTKMANQIANPEEEGDRPLSLREPLVIQQLSRTPEEAKKADIRTEEGYTEARKTAMLRQKVDGWFTR